MKKRKHPQFAEKLKTARRNAGFKTAEEFALEINVAGPTYRVYERGDTLPRPLTLMRICGLLLVTPGYLLTDH